MTLKEAGFRGTEVAVGGGKELAIGLLADGTPIMVAKTPLGEGYTPYPTLIAAGRAFDEIVEKTGLARL